MKAREAFSSIPPANGFMAIKPTSCCLASGKSSSAGSQVIKLNGNMRVSNRSDFTRSLAMSIWCELMPIWRTTPAFLASSSTDMGPSGARMAVKAASLLTLWNW